MKLLFSVKIRTIKTLRVLIDIASTRKFIFKISRGSIVRVRFLIKNSKLALHCNYIASIEEKKSIDK